LDIALPSFILGYHGCDAKVAADVVAGKTQLELSNNDYDWLGDGIYFWEHNAQRAFDFAKLMRDRPHPSGQKIKTPAVIGAVIDLGYCLNLLDASHIALVKNAHKQFIKLFAGVEELVPKNTGGPDRVNRKLDCAVMRYLHNTREFQGQTGFDSVRAAFFEGKPIYDNAGFAANTHIQIAVREHARSRILGYFHPLDEKGKPRKFK